MLVNSSQKPDVYFQNRAIGNGNTTVTIKDTVDGATPKTQEEKDREKSFFEALHAKKPKREIDNPRGQLGGDDFLKLFLESLKFQDPTSPVETKDMMVQTAQLTTVETNVANKKALEAVTKTLTQSSQYQAQFALLPAIGKMAITKLDTVNFDGSNPKDFKLYFESEPQAGSITIEDDKGNKIKELSLVNYINETGKEGEDEQGFKIKETKGMLSFTWNGTSDTGATTKKGNYKIFANYTGKDAKVHKINIGTSIVESVKFDKGQPLLKLGDKYVEFSQINEIR